MQPQAQDQEQPVHPGSAAVGQGVGYGAPGCEREKAADLNLRWPVNHLAKLYVEPTSRCNLACRTCVRNVWDEPLGAMGDETFARIINGLQSFHPAPAVFFGGFGEPLAHPKIVEMVAQAKALGGRVELITNGTLLSEAMARGLIATGLDALWVSLDGARPESYADVRLGAAFAEVVRNVARFRDCRPPRHLSPPEIGIAFVAMKRNIADLPDLLQLARRLGANRLLVSNVLPHTAEMRDEALYTGALAASTYVASPWVPQVSLPKIDLDEITRRPLYQALRSGWNVNLAGANLGDANDRCPFVESGAAAISWEGSFSPCLPLLHSHASFLDRRPRFSRRYVVGSLAERDLAQLWNAPDHVNFRERVRHFSFSPCTFCGGCELSQTNEEDCMGNSFPTCGGCLWAQGIIQCP
jgi:MoaA/NifB/PqqE/SkfB family radical SAM enzyme